MLLMHDANFFGGAYLEALNAKGVRALFALPSTVGVQRRRNLPDGSYLALLKPNAQAVYPMQQPVWVRVIEYQLTDERLGEPGQVYRLATTWLNPHTAPAKELIVLYHERWEIEIVVDGIKTHLRLNRFGQRSALRILCSCWFDRRAPNSWRRRYRWPLFEMYWAQGYAEADPTDDVEGDDTVAKTLILAAAAFGRALTPEQVVGRGITMVTGEQIQPAFDA